MWICNKQVNEVDKETYKNLFLKIRYTQQIYLILLNLIHFKLLYWEVFYQKLNKNKFSISSNTFSFEGEWSSELTDKQMIVEKCKMFLNSPYLWGGRTPLWY